MDRSRWIEARRCIGCGALYIHDHEKCPACRAPLCSVRIGAGAVLVSHTTVRVNPTGRPYRIGVAVAAAGASTLCVVEGAVRGNGRDRVRLVYRDGRYHALAARARVTRSPSLPASDGDSRKS